MLKSYRHIASFLTLKHGLTTNTFRRAYNFDVSKEVKHGLTIRAPVVALESTIITHGMPYPDNIKCALAVENIIREQGAIPATIAIIGGKVTVGLNSDQINRLGDINQTDSIKTSRRDFPFILSQKLNGGTTVSGTIIIAEKMGIPIFVTGGIGGVHRDGENSLDISADLTELGRSSIAVVSSGVKSILDIPKTLEYLETQGVFVAAFGNTTDFPAFYSRKSGSHVPYNVNTARQAAEIIESSVALGLKSGMLFAVPVPEVNALDETQLNEAIEQALQQAKHQGVTGKQITPFLLGAVAKMTSGKSLQTNMALIQNNALVGAQIAVELSHLRNNTARKIKEADDVQMKRTTPPVVIGGCVLDCCAKLEATDIKLNGSLHYTKFTVSAGGVGRNMCEALGKLGDAPMLLSAVGDDNHGNYLRSLLPSDSTKTIKLVPGATTAQCTIMLDANGECKLLLGEMDMHKQITPEMIRTQEELLKQSPLIVTDGNLPIETLACVLEIAEKYGKPVFYEPTDLPIAANPFKCPKSKSLKFISPNMNELRTIAETLGISLPKKSADVLVEAVELGKLVQDHVDTILVTLGARGLVIIRKGEANDSLLLTNLNADVKARYYKTNEITDLVNVSGAGDCFASGLIAAMLAGCPENVCVSVGFAAAQMALQTRCAVPTKMFDKSHVSYTQEAPYVEL